MCLQQMRACSETVHCGREGEGRGGEGRGGEGGDH